MKSNEYLQSLKDFHGKKEEAGDTVELLTESEEYLEEGTISSLLAIYFWGPVPWTLWRTLRAAIDKAHKKCGTYDVTDKRDICIAKEKIKDCKKRIKMLRRRAKDCKNKRDPEKCRKTGKKIIKKYEEKKDKYKKRLKKLED